MDRCPARIIGVTGSKGKSTTCALIARILGEAGWRTWVGGSAGKPPMSFLSQVRASHLVVLELSSRDLLDLDVSPHIAVCLEVLPGDTSSHRNLREAVAAQGNIFWHQQADDMAVFNARNEFAAEIGQLSPGRRLPYLKAPGGRLERDRVVVGETSICATSEVALLGRHNLENVCGAVTAVWDLMGRNTEAARRALKAFRGLEHRLEPAGQVGGVWYYNDATADIPEAAVAAMQTFEQPKIIILGGANSRANHAELVRAVADLEVRNAVLYGEAAGQLAKELEAVGFKKAIIGPRSMGEIVGSARALAQPGDVVLLSPGCPADGKFRDYQDLGDQFKAAVKALN